MMLVEDRKRIHSVKFHYDELLFVVFGILIRANFL
jgi:hypothetical protein